MATPVRRRVPGAGYIEQRDGYRLWVGGPVPPGSAGITFGSTVIVRKGREERRRLLMHELVHVEQYRRHGLVGFWIRYLTAYLGWRLRGYDHWSSYRRIPFEVEAIWRTRQGTAPQP